MPKDKNKKAKPFSAFAHMYESLEEEAARLAASPEGSEHHTLSTLPVNIRGWVEDKLIELPKELTNGHTMVVVPFRYSAPSKSEQKKAPPYRRHQGWWSVIVVASDNPHYKVGGHRLSISEAQLVRGKLRQDDLLPEGVASLSVR